MRMKEEGRNPRLQWSHIFCYPRLLLIGANHGSWSVIRQDGAASNPKPSKCSCWATASKSQIEVKELPGLSLNPPKKAFRLLLKWCFCVLFSDSSQSSSLFFPSRKSPAKKKVFRVCSHSSNTPASRSPFHSTQYGIVIRYKLKVYFLPFSNYTGLWELYSA